MMNAERKDVSLSALVIPNSAFNSSFTIQHSASAFSIQNRARMITFQPRKPNRYRPRTPAPASLLLIAATYQSGVSVRLTFDRAVNIGAINVAAFYVNDDDSDEAYTGTGAATLLGPQQVQVPLAILHGSTGPGTELTVSAASGIVAADDGGNWAGVDVLPLPYP
jgi:hypothetical protein